MITAGSRSEPLTKPLWLLAELTYSCPLQCPYCSNPLDYPSYSKELSTAEWKRVLSEARAMGAAQLGLSGGEPLVRQDLAELIAHASELGYYTNLITSGIGMTEEKIKLFKEAGLDHIQVSFQSSREDLNNLLAGTDAFQHKVEITRLIKKYGYPMVLCFVMHRENFDHIDEIIELAIALQGDYLELATVQYSGWALLNRDRFMPNREQLKKAEAIAHQYQEKLKGKMRIFYVVPDYHEDRPKPCMNGWGNIFLTIAPDGVALPCHTARELPGLKLPNVRDHDIEWIWNSSPDFNLYRGEDWMREPCRTCPERKKDFGGCRCQAYLLTGDARNADPVCSKSSHHRIVLDAIDRAEAQAGSEHKVPIIFRNPKNAKLHMNKHDDP